MPGFGQSLTDASTARLEATIGWSPRVCLVTRFAYKSEEDDVEWTPKMVEARAEFNFQLLL